MRTAIGRKGFTLIELMIVVAIIGILATLATSAFLTYQTKAKQSEAKINLAAIGVSAQSYYTEHDTYVTAFNELGWTPNLVTRYCYWYNGQWIEGTPPANPDPCTTYGDPGSLATGTTFVAMAAGNIDQDATADIWSYNQMRTLDNIQNDVNTP
ncbi:MAG TPA: prepilin-type N-terminal cleavage/methylation domain-containing protein [Nitrospiria bacterium]|nr:prepilin-type N-terminal cleavage/methylation domain-containing protein [Nitrospiria bacterium]